MVRAYQGERRVGRLKGGRAYLSWSPARVADRVFSAPADALRNASSQRSKKPWAPILFPQPLHNNGCDKQMFGAE
jgi:hypothetical protein